MDQNTPREEIQAKSPKTARVALNVLAVCFALSVLGRGLADSFTVFLKPISEDFGWDRAQVVSVYSLTWLAAGLTAPLVGRLFDRSGPRIVYSLGLLLLGGAFLAGAHSQHLWQFQLSVGLGVGLGIALIGNVPNSILLGRWFGPRLPTAMAILYSATGAGILVLLPASQLLIDRIGWRDAYQLFGIVALCLLLPLLVMPPWKNPLRKTMVIQVSVMISASRRRSGRPYSGAPTSASWMPSMNSSVRTRARVYPQ